MAKHRTRKAGHKKKQRGGLFGFFEKKTSNAPKHDPQRELAFREVWAAYSNFYNKRARFIKNRGPLYPEEQQLISDEYLASTANSQGLVPENVRLFRMGAKTLQGAKNIAGTAGVGIGLAGSAVAQGSRALGSAAATGARAVGSAAATGARAVGSLGVQGAKSTWSGMKSFGSATRNAASKTGSWFSRKATNASTAARSGATALSQGFAKATEGPAAEAKRLLEEVESNPFLNSTTKNTKLAKVRSLMNSPRMGYTEKTNIQRRLAAARAAKPASGYNTASEATPNTSNSQSIESVNSSTNMSSVNSRSTNKASNENNTAARFVM